MKTIPVRIDDHIGISGDDDVVLDPFGCAMGPDHIPNLGVQAPPVFALALGVKKNHRNAIHNRKLHIAQGNSQFLQRADAADVEDGKRPPQTISAGCGGRWLEKPGRNPHP